MKRVFLFLLLGLFFVSFASADLTDSLEHYWKLDETSGAVIDSHGTNNGTNVDATTGATGIINTGYSYSEDTTTFGADSNFYNDKNFSVSLWINATDDSVRKNIFSVSSGTTSWTIGLNNGEIICKSGSGAVTSGGAVASLTNNWHHIVMLHTTTGSDTASIDVYVDGVLTTGYGNQAPAVSSNLGFVLGKNTNPSVPQGFVGTIDEVGMWSRLLNTTEIGLLYAQTPYDSFTPTPQTLLTNLLSYYKFDETAGAYANDSHGTNHGLANDPTKGTSGVINTAFDFEGVDDDVQYSDFGFTGTEFTYSMWINADDALSEQWFLWYRGANFNTRASLNDGNNLTITAGLGVVAYNGPVAGNGWMHILWTGDAGGNVSLYVDGNYIGSDTSASANGGSLASWIGSTGTNRYFEGDIDEVGIWDREVTPAEIALLYAQTPYDNFAGTQTLLTNLEHYYSFEEGAGASGTIIDELGNVNLTNGGTSNTTGKLGSGYDFENDEADDILIFSGGANPYSTLNSGGDGLTLNMWVKPESFGSSSEYNILFGIGNAQRQQYQISSNLAGQDLTYSAGGSVNTITATPLATGTWSMMTYVFEGTTAKLYVGGVLIATNTTASNVDWGATDSGFFGSRYSGGHTSHSFDGVMDEVGIWSRALNETEITLLATGIGFEDFNGTITQTTCTVLGAGNYTVSNGNLVADISSSYLYSENVRVSYDYSGLGGTSASATIDETKGSLSSVTGWFPIFLIVAIMVVLITLVIIIVKSSKGLKFSA